MAVVKKEVDYAKECGDVMVLVVEVVKHFKAGKGLAEATELLDELMGAISGVDQVDDEWKADKVAVLNAVLVHAGELAGVFMAEESQA